MTDAEIRLELIKMFWEKMGEKTSLYDCLLIASKVSEFVIMGKIPNHSVEKK